LANFEAAGTAYSGKQPAEGCGPHIHLLCSE